MAALDAAAALPPIIDTARVNDGESSGLSSVSSEMGSLSISGNDGSRLMESANLPNPMPPPAPTVSPFVTKQIAVAINGIHTEFLLQSFSDRVFVTISQLNAVGTLLYATSEDDSCGGKSFDVRVLMGRRDDPLLVLYARQLIEHFSATTERPLMLAVSLKQEGRSSETFQTIINICLELRCW